MLSVLFVRRSRRGLPTGVVTCASLLSGSISGVVVETVATFVRSVPRVPEFGRTTTVTVRWAPFRIVPSEHSTVSPATVVAPGTGVTGQLPTEGVADRKVTFSGRRSTIETFSASDRPLSMFVAVRT